jgi:hypothetical protein
MAKWCTALEGESVLTDAAKRQMWTRVALAGGNTAAASLDSRPT